MAVQKHKIQNKIILVILVKIAKILVSEHVWTLMSYMLNNAA